MPSIEYDTIFARFCLKIEDYKLLRMNAHDQRDLMKMWLQAALSDPDLSFVFDELNADDDLEQLRYTLKTGGKTLTGAEAIAELFSLGMVIQWLQPQIYSSLNTRQLAENRRDKFTSPPVLLSELRALFDDLHRSYLQKIRALAALRLMGGG